LALVFVAVNGLWLSQDRLVRDGDEEGHVGAAELFLVDLATGKPGNFLHRAFVADMGDYPSLYPASVGLWWWAAQGGPPERPLVRGFNLVWLLLAAGAVWVSVRSLGLRTGAVAAAAVLHLPLGVGMARHFMPEGALAGTVALAVAAACWQRARPTPGRAIVLGAALGLGLLTKQTFPLYAAVPVLVAVRWRPSLAWAALGAGIAAPWVITNWAEQLEYSTSSAGYRGDAGLWAHATYYPLALAGPALGPVWCVLTGAAAVLGWRRHRPVVLLGLAWLLGGALLLTAVPKKYDRLLVPLLPACGLLFAAAVSARPRTAPLLLFGVAWTTWLSFDDPPLAEPYAPLVDFEPGCLQQWLRPPTTQDLGLAPILAAAAQAPDGPVLVLGGPPIPCDIQTTFDWAYHLGPFLRRGGQERPVVSAGAGELVVDFSPDAQGERHQVPLLDTSYALRW
jgi:hypothetical protein